MVIHGAFFCIQLFPILQCVIFGVIQDQVPDMQGFSQFTGILYRGMMLLIWLVFVSLPIEAECFMKKPFTVFGICFFARVKWFITAAGLFFFSVFYFNHMNLFANGSAVFLLKEQFCHGVQDMNDLLMAINIQFPFQTFFCNNYSQQYCGSVQK